MNKTKQTILENKICCAGHIKPRNERCLGCEADEFNKCCEDYCPTRLYILDIPEKKNKKQENNRVPCYQR